MLDSWSREEVEAAVADYFSMLNQELRGNSFNKAEHNRNLRAMLANRSAGSVERKHQNISAILLEFGYPYINGYKPLGNYQALLRDVVLEKISMADDLNKSVAEAVATPVKEPPSISDILAIRVPPPEKRDDAPRIYETSTATLNSAKRDYLEMEARNQSLGRAGEEFILRFEHERLWRAGNRKLADRVEHISRTRGDHLGYDILSFEEDGRERLIEVKTTRFGVSTPFFATRNEVEFSSIRSTDYHLYRLFSFRKVPKLFTLTGSLKKTCRLAPFVYLAQAD